MEKLSGNALILAAWLLAAVPHVLAQDTTPPTLVSKTPEDFASGVDRLAPIVLTFSEPMRAQGDITVGAATGGFFSVLCSWSASGRTLTCAPVSAFPANTFIVWELDTTTFTDLAGNELEATGEELGFYLTGSTSTNATNDPIAFANPASAPGGGFQFTLNASAERTVLVEYANQLTNWVPLVITNTLAPSTTITDSNQSDRSRIYRARYVVP